MAVLISFYTVMLLVFWILDKKRPGITAYQNPAGRYLNILSAVHFIAVLLMLLPAWLITPLPLYLLAVTANIGSVRLITLLACIVLMVCMPWKKWSSIGHVHENYFPSTGEVILYATFRIIFLMVYEWFFRGLLLTGLIDVTGVFYAVIINILLYMLAHFHKDRKEILGCIPFGLLLCLFTIWWQCVWPAVIIHLTLAVLNEGPPVSRFFTPSKKTAW